jgi:hypothetical protein
VAEGIKGQFARIAVRGERGGGGVKSHCMTSGLKDSRLRQRKDARWGEE